MYELSERIEQLALNLFLPSWCASLSSSIPKAPSFPPFSLYTKREKAMRKYIRKGKLTAGEVGSHNHHHHHQTRARTKTLAVVQKPKPRAKPKSRSKPDPKPDLSSDSDSSELCYLQLRSRRLIRRNFAPKARKAKGSSGLKGSPSGSKGKAGSGVGVEVEAEVGENVVELEVGAKSNRSSRETTPCSLIKRDSETIRTPGSTSRGTTTSATNRMIQSPPRRNLPTSRLPTSREMDEFFSVPEKRQQRAFKERYNFDPVKGRPLPGRYEWIKLKK